MMWKHCSVSVSKSRLWGLTNVTQTGSLTRSGQKVFPFYFTLHSTFQTRSVSSCALKALLPWGGPPMLFRWRSGDNIQFAYCWRQTDSLCIWVTEFRSWQLLPPLLKDPLLLCCSPSHFPCRRGHSVLTNFSFLCTPTPSSASNTFQFSFITYSQTLSVKKAEIYSCLLNCWLKVLVRRWS